MKIGEYEYPSITLEEALKITKIVLRFNGQMPAKALAEKMGYTIKKTMGGVPYHKIAATKQFGLLEGKGTIKMTPLAEKALHPYDETAANEAKKEAYSHINIIQPIHAKCEGRVPTENDFPLTLSNITGANWVESKKHAKAIRKLYIESLQYLESGESPKPPTFGSDETPILGGEEISSRRDVEMTGEVKEEDVYGELRTRDGYIRIKDTETFLAAQGLWGILERRFKPKAEMSSEEK